MALFEPVAEAVANLGRRDGEARGQAGFREQQNQSEHSDFSSKSTTAEAQRRRVITMLREGPRSTFELRAAGVMQSSTRVLELRRQGYQIVTARRIVAADADGFVHAGVAVYVLLSEPEEADHAH